MSPIFTSGYRFRELGDDPEYVQDCLDVLWWDTLQSEVHRLWNGGLYKLEDLIPALVDSKFHQGDDEGRQRVALFLEREVSVRLGCEDGWMRHPEQTGMRLRDGFVLVRNTMPWSECVELDRAFAPLVGIEGSIMDREPRSYIAPRDVVLGLAKAV